MKSFNKYIFAFIIISFYANGADVDKKCSPETMEKLIEKLAIVVGEVGAREMKTRKLFSKDNLKLTNTELREQYLKIGSAQSPEYEKSLKEINELAEKHPECDKKYLLRIKNK